MVMAIAVPIMIQNGLTILCNLLDNIMVRKTGNRRDVGCFDRQSDHICV